MTGFSTVNMDDSGDDLFITQSSFCTVDVDTQDASDAVDFLHTSFDLFQESETSAPEVVQYWDFTNDVLHTENVSSPKKTPATESPKPTDLGIPSGATFAQPHDNSAEASDNVTASKEPLIQLEADFTVEDYALGRGY